MGSAGRPSSSPPSPGSAVLRSCANVETELSRYDSTPRGRGHQGRSSRSHRHRARRIDRAEGLPRRQTVLERMARQASKAARPAPRPGGGQAPAQLRVHDEEPPKFEKLPSSCTAVLNRCSRHEAVDPSIPAGRPTVARWSGVPDAGTRRRARHLGQFRDFMTVRQMFPPESDLDSC